jgi:hypothetical protein
VPQDLPAIVAPDDPEADKEGHESQWENRATMLARENEKNRSRPPTPVRDMTHDLAHVRLHNGSSDDAPPNWPLAAPPSPSGPKKGVVSSKEIDDNIQEAIRLHEAGDLERSTALFGRLADPKGANNPLSQVLYGLALRYVHLTLTLTRHPAAKMLMMHTAHIWWGVVSSPGRIVWP